MSWYCQIDWDATGSMLSGLGTWIGAVAVFLVANLWKKQKIAERRCEQAERILIATYKVQQALAHIRRILVQGHESAAAENKLKQDSLEWSESVSEKRKRMEFAQVYLDRINATWDDWVELEKCLPMARALFGKHIENAIKKINNQLFVMNDASRDYIYVPDQSDHHQRILLILGSRKPRNEEVDNVLQATSEAVKIIEDTCLPALILESNKNGAFCTSAKARGYLSVWRRKKL